MAKRKNDLTSPAGDYIDQLEWQANHRRRRTDSVYYEPKWKYRIVYRYPATTLLGRFFRAFELAVLVGLPAYLIVSSDAALGAKVFFSTMLALIVAVFFFAARDASTDDDDKSERLDS